MVFVCFESTLMLVVLKIQGKIIVFIVLYLKWGAQMDTTWLIIWLAAAVIFGIVELATVQLVSIWLAIGSVVAMIACTFGAPVWVQLLVFGAASALFLILTRPFVKKVIKIKPVSTNAHRMIGKTVVVTEKIGKNSYGAVKFSGVTWTAKSESGEEIQTGENVIIKAIEGSKLIVSKKQP